MSGPALAAILIGSGIGLSAVMAAAWGIQQRTGNSGWVDASWTFGVGAIGAIAALVPLDGSQPWRQILVATLVAAWALRLGSHIVARTRAGPDDPRYHKMAQDWGADAPRRMFWFLQTQAVAGLPLVAAVMLAAHDASREFRVQDLLGAAILMVAVVGEKIADDQMRRFSSDPANRGAICDRGLWGWSRHPNYFFEWIGWFAYPAIAIDVTGTNPFGWLALLAPATMYWLLVHVSGIPPLEAHLARSRGEAFRAYQRRTRAFFPIPQPATR